MITATRHQNLTAFITDRYDHLVSGSGGALPVAETREALREAVMAELADSPRDIEAEADHWIKQVTDSVRGSRNSWLKRELEWILEAIANPADSIGLESVLDKAFPLGRHDGSDKTLRYWTRDDYLFAARTRFQVAAEQTASAAEFDRTVQRVIDVLDERGVANLDALT